MKHKGKSLDAVLKDLARDYDLDADGEDSELVAQLGRYAKYIGDRSGETARDTVDAAED